MGVYRELSPTSEIRAEIQLRAGHLFWAKHQQTSATIDLGTIFNEYWSSTKHEFIVPSQLCAPASLLISDRKGQRSLELENIVGLLNSDSLPTLRFVLLKPLIQVN